MINGTTLTSRQKADFRFRGNAKHTPAILKTKNSNPKLSQGLSYTHRIHCEISVLFLENKEISVTKPILCVSSFQKMWLKTAS